ncbi:MAG: transposase, partial [Gammaproteobacteria bacterium]|nr:transposase [Gammaproteobacteria bacterium]
IYLHRHQAHRALDLHPLVSHFFRFWLWLTTGMRTIDWVAVHRKHHAECETVDDPHSPQILGIKKVLTQGAELYQTEAANPKTLEQFGKGTPTDWIERNLYLRFSYLGIVVMLLVNVTLFGALGLTVWAVQMMWIPVWAAGVINGIGHWRGYRNYECADASRNISPIGLLIGGEELHNNHHTYPNSAKLSSKWWEFDIGWMYIRILDVLRLARVRKVPPKPFIVLSKARIDADTLAAVVINRFQVMSRYCRIVIYPVLKEEFHKADVSYRQLFKRSRTLLVREESLLNADAKLKLETVLSRSQALRTVYRFKQQLQEIGRRSTATQEVLLRQLQEWCKQAEETGIRALQEFARSLPAYTLRMA